MYAEHRHGALSVLETPHTKDHINRELKQLDSRLFIELQRTIADPEPIWVVNIDLANDGIYAIHEHRDGNGVGIGYPTHRMVEEIQRMMQRGPIDVKELDRRNKAKRERRRREIYAGLRENANDRQKSAHPIHSALLPRGQSLRIARSKQRREELTRMQLAYRAKRMGLT